MPNTTGSETRHVRSHVLLAPRNSTIPSGFTNATANPALYESLIADMQRLRGRAYVEDGALQPSAVPPDGRHRSSLDERCWHILTLEQDGRVGGCARLLVHSGRPTFEQLFVSGSALAKSLEWGDRLRNSVEAEVAAANRLLLSFVEVGGWVVSQALRHSTEALKIALGAFAFGELTGGAIGLATATFRNHSAPILSRLGGKRLHDRGVELPSYYDPQYTADMAILRFESWSYAPKFTSVVHELRELLRYAPVICPDSFALVNSAIPDSAMYEPARAVYSRIAA